MLILALLYRNLCFKMINDQISMTYIIRTYKGGWVPYVPILNT